MLFFFCYQIEPTAKFPVRRADRLVESKTANVPRFSDLVVLGKDKNNKIKPFKPNKSIQEKPERAIPPTKKVTPKLPQLPPQLTIPTRTTIENDNNNSNTPIIDIISVSPIPTKIPSTTNTSLFAPVGGTPSSFTTMPSFTASSNLTRITPSSPKASFNIAPLPVTTTTTTILSTKTSTPPSNISIPSPIFAANTVVNSRSSPTLPFIPNSNTDIAITTVTGTIPLSPRASIVTTTATTTTTNPPIFGLPGQSGSSLYLQQQQQTEERTTLPNRLSPKSTLAQLEKQQQEREREEKIRVLKEQQQRLLQQEAEDRERKRKEKEKQEQRKRQREAIAQFKRNQTIKRLQEHFHQWRETVQHLKQERIRQEQERAERERLRYQQFIQSLGTNNAEPILMGGSSKDRLQRLLSSAGYLVEPIMNQPQIPHQMLQQENSIHQYFRKMNEMVFITFLVL